jgi:hypothetical protein
VCPQHGGDLARATPLDMGAEAFARANPFDLRAAIGRRLPPANPAFHFQTIARSQVHAYDS